MSVVRKPGRARGKRVEGPLYHAAWWEKRLPWLLDLLAALDPDPLARRLEPLYSPFRRAIELVCQPFALGLEIAGRLLRGIFGAIDGLVTATLRALPLPGFLKDALWLRPRELSSSGADSAHALWRLQHRKTVPLALILAVALHAATFAFWPTIGVDDLSTSATELEAVELPPQIDVPPPPQRISRPAAPVIATADIDEDITIAPTTFEENPVTELPPPPTEEVVEETIGPSFTPFTVAPRILNVTEVRTLLITEYPPLLRDAGIGGEIVMWFFIDEEGGILQMRIAKGSGHESLDAAAFRVAERIRFSPALNRDEHVRVWVQFPIEFSVRQDLPQAAAAPNLRPIQS